MAEKTGEELICYRCGKKVRKESQFIIVEIHGGIAHVTCFLDALELDRHLCGVLYEMEDSHPDKELQDAAYLFRCVVTGKKP